MENYGDMFGFPNPDGNADVQIFKYNDPNSGTMNVGASAWRRPKGKSMAFILSVSPGGGGGGGGANTAGSTKGGGAGGGAGSVIKMLMPIFTLPDILFVSVAGGGAGGAGAASNGSNGTAGSSAGFNSVAASLMGLDDNASGKTPYTLISGHSGGNGGGAGLTSGSNATGGTVASVLSTSMGPLSAMALYGHTFSTSNFAIPGGAGGTGQATAAGTAVSLSGQGNIAPFTGGAGGGGSSASNTAGGGFTGNTVFIGVFQSFFDTSTHGGAAGGGKGEDAFEINLNGYIYRIGGGGGGSSNSVAGGAGGNSNHIPGVGGGGGGGGVGTGGAGGNGGPGLVVIISF